ncbi:MAG: ATP-grasp domain-containing protein, partial [Rhodobacteraceae bacterium]|nr:ATP-grasp domain-containing protein [Paracoccaceae bacterium]
LRCVAVFSEPDSLAPHVLAADEAICIGSGPVQESYLNSSRIIAAAKKSGAQAVHPGYGFFSEDAEFACAVIKAGLVFVGPSPEAIRKMGNKAEAKQLMKAAGVLCVPGYDGAVQSDEELRRQAVAIGFPVMVKAAAGGGGRGMRLVHEEAQLEEALRSARAEAEQAFGSDQLILEKAILGARHVEVQVFADSHGNFVHLGERDCSLQRRHQKVIEESPSPAVSPMLRAELGAAAITAAKAVDYLGAGTVEFLLDDSGDYFFLEMNTRLQVEHPVTEMVTGLDLVALQLSVATGGQLPFAQDDIQLNGHAIEARLCAEDPVRNFLPATGRVTLWQPAAGENLRFDAGISTGSVVSPFYDSLLAKVIARGDTREEARTRLKTALSDTVLLGLPSNKAFLAEVLGAPEFIAGETKTDLLGRTYPDGFCAPKADPEQIMIAAALMVLSDQCTAQSSQGYSSDKLLGWSSASTLAVPLNIVSGGVEFSANVTVNLGIVLACLNGAERSIRVLGLEEFEAELTVNEVRQVINYAKGRDGSIEVSFGRFSHRFHRSETEHSTAASNSGRVVAPMPGLVVDVLVANGQSVACGDTIAILEAMKMQHRILAEIDGVVDTIAVKKGDQLGSGDLIAKLEGDGPEEPEAGGKDAAG